MHTSLTTTLALTAAILLAPASLAMAQTTAPAAGTTTGVVPSDHNDDGFDLGWLGLIGLIGLAGLRRQKVVPVDHGVRRAV